MPFQIIRNDITKVKADAIVNTANPLPIVGSGTDSAVYNAAGRRALLKERQKIGNIAPGEAASTGAFRLDAKYIIHTVGPAWVDGKHRERETLRSCYANSLALADELSCESIAFPLIATGVYGFPKDEALQIALDEIKRFLLQHEMDVVLVVFDRKSFELSGKLVGDIDEYLEEHEFVYEAERRRYRTTSIACPKPVMYENEHEDAICCSLTDMSLEEMLDNRGETFQQRLLELIDESGMDDVTVYKKANIDRKLFSKIRSKEDYNPKKKTAVALAIALQLDMQTMEDLLGRAGIALSPSSKFDLIITYFVTNKDYNMYDINAALFKYGLPLLGA